MTTRGEITTVLTVGVSDTMARRMRGASERDDAFRLMEATTQSEAVSILQDVRPTVIVINLGMVAGSPVAVADYAAFRLPDARIVYEMGDGRSGFEDGSIFAHCANAHACVTSSMGEGDMAAFLAHQAASARPNRPH